jgi:hypothetical protein
MVTGSYLKSSYILYSKFCDAARGLVSKREHPLPVSTHILIVTDECSFLIEVKNRLLTLHKPLRHSCSYQSLVDNKSMASRKKK